MMNSKIKNIVFDFGGVLVDLNKQQTIDAFYKLGCDVRNDIRDYVQQGPFSLLEKGAIGVDEFCNQIRILNKNTEGEPLTSIQICYAWNQMLVDVPKRRLQALLKLRKRYRVFLLSNTNSIHWEYACKEFFLKQGYAVEHCFEHTYLSYQLGMMKPDKVIFKTLLAQENLKAQETLFIDDSHDNCTAAALLGFDTFCPKEADDWFPLFL